MLSSLQRVKLPASEDPTMVYLLRHVPVITGWI
jgi:hypothetical protein